MIDSLLSGNICGIFRHNFWDLTLIFWSLKCTLCKKIHVMTKTVIVFHVQKYNLKIRCAILLRQVVELRQEKRFNEFFF